MTGKAILEALSFIDEEYIDEAETGTIRSAAIQFPKILLPMAACLCLVLAMNSWAKSATAEAQIPEEQASQDMIAETWVELDKEQDVSAAEMEIAMDEAKSPETGISAILRIEKWTDGGFTAIVESTGDTDELEPGMGVEVLFSDAICVETYADGMVIAERRDPTETDFPAGVLVQVRISDIFDERTEIVIKSIALAEP